jgi:uncharacterized Zn finger protein (UPF0148 family)
MSVALETCANCGRTIGKLEPAQLHQGNIVCPACKRTLSEAMPAEPAEDFAAEMERELDAKIDDSERRKLNYQRSQAQRARSKVMTGQGQAWGAGKIVRMLGTLGAIAGTILVVIGLKAINNPDIDWAKPVAGVGILIALLSMLVFAAGRIMKD